MTFITLQYNILSAGGILIAVRSFCTQPSIPIGCTPAFSVTKIAH